MKLLSAIVAPSRWPHGALAVACCAAVAAPAAALDCPVMPQQASRDAEVEVRVGVRGIADARGAELASKTRTLTVDLLGRLPQADRVYLEQMLFASYCSAVKGNALLAEAERESRVRAYAAELRNALAGGGVPRPPPADPRDVARAELARLPLPYTFGALLAASERGDARVVGLFIAAGMDVNPAPSTDGWGAPRRLESPLENAAARGDLPMVRALLKAGAKVDLKLHGLSTALTAAAANGQVDVLRAMLAARPSQESVERAFVVAGRQSQLAALDVLLRQGVDPKVHGLQALLDLPTWGSNPAAPAMVRRLLELGVPLDAPDSQGLNFLLYAVRNKHIALVRLALDAGANVNQRCECSGIEEGGLTPLNAAAMDGSDDIVDIIALLLERGADVKARSRSGRTPLLMLMDSRPGSDAVPLLLKAGADANAKDDNGNTALMSSARQGGWHLQALLAAGATAEQHNRRGETPLMTAARNGDADSIAALLGAGAAVDARSPRGRTPLMFAALAGEVDAAKLLLQRGAAPLLRDEDGKTAAELAAEALKDDERTRMLTALRLAAPAAAR